MQAYGQRNCEAADALPDVCREAVPSGARRAREATHVDMMFHGGTAHLACVVSRDRCGGTMTHRACTRR